jgi:hypothetical protein
MARHWAKKRCWGMPGRVGQHFGVQPLPLRCLEAESARVVARVGTVLNETSRQRQRPRWCSDGGQKG